MLIMIDLGLMDLYGLMLRIILGPFYMRIFSGFNWCWSNTQVLVSDCITLSW